MRELGSNAPGPSTHLLCLHCVTTNHTVVGGTEKVKPPLWPRRRSLLHNDAEEEERAIERTA
jgi:hypothetical protein